MENNYHLARRFGLTAAKNYIRRSALHDTEDIYNSCYACEYVFQVVLQKSETFSCKYCPVCMERCSSVHSILYCMSSALQKDDELTYQLSCREMADVTVKANVDWE